jgi:hypothetical protein
MGKMYNEEVRKLRIVSALPHYVLSEFRHREICNTDSEITVIISTRQDVNNM